MSNRHPLRLAPLPGTEWQEHTRAALASLIPPERAHPAGAGNVLSTLVRHPELTRAYLPFNAYLLKHSTLSPRIREVALLRVVHRRDCDYLWSHHLPIARSAGLTDGDIAAIRDGNLADVRPDLTDQAVLHAVDALVDRGTISTPVWNTLGRHLTDQQRMDLVFTVGGYELLAMAVNTFGVEDEAQ